jgi:hypothetical protein
MPREGAIIFRDIVGKLDVLRVECDKCGRAGRYRVDRLIERYGIDAKLFDWFDESTADCLAQTGSESERHLWRQVPGSAEGSVTVTGALSVAASCVCSCAGKRISLPMWCSTIILSGWAVESQ